MPTKTTGKGLQRVTSRVCYITNPDIPCPRETRSKGGEAMLRCFREEEEKTRGARKNLFIWIVILSSNDSNGFTSFKIIKAAVLNTVTLSPCSASLSLSLSHTHTHTHTHTLTLSLSFRSSNKLQQTVPIIHIFHTAMRSIVMDTRAVAVLY